MLTHHARKTHLQTPWYIYIWIWVTWFTVAVVEQRRGKLCVGSRHVLAVHDQRNDKLAMWWSAGIYTILQPPHQVVV